MSRVRRMPGSIALLSMLVLLLPSAAVAAGPSDQLPDLVMARPQDIRLKVTGGQKILQFSTIIVNAGVGPLEVHGTRITDCPNPPCDKMTTEQFIRRTDGTWRHVPSAAEQRFAPDVNHYHWHVIDMERYELFPMDAPFSDGPVTGHKYGYCFFDGEHRRPRLARSPKVPHYSFWDCGKPDSQSTRVGLPVGWGDIYPYNFYGQGIDVSNVPDGDYLICIGADPFDYFLETDNTNNQAWAKVSISGATIHIGLHGRSACSAQLPW